MCTQGCEEGYYFDEWSGRCRRCGMNCLDCDKWYECTACENGYTPRHGFCYCASGQYGPDFECLESTCDAGQWRNENGDCLMCPDNCAECDYETGECTQCMDGYTAQNDDGCGCWDGAFDNGYGCVTCETGEFFHSDYRSCQPCMENCDECYWSDSCAMCADTFSFDDYGWCYCAGGTYEVDGRCEDIPMCDDAEFFDGEACSSCGDLCMTCNSFSGECV